MKKSTTFNEPPETVDRFHQNLYSISKILISQGDTKQPLTIWQTAELRVKNIACWVDQITFQFLVPFLKVQGRILCFSDAVNYQMLPNIATV